MRKSRQIRLVIYLILLLYTCGSAHAVSLPFGSTGPDVRSLQLRLVELQYYTSDVSGEFDMPTQAALDTYCRQIGMSLGDGISSEVWSMLFSQDAPQKEQKTDTPPLVPGSTGAAVIALQSRLLELGFYQETFAAGLYDPSTQYAQDRFCDKNGIEKQSGASSALQMLILSNGVHGAKESDLDSASQVNLQTIMFAPVVIAGFRLPAIVYYATGLLLLALIIILFINIAQNSRNNPSRELIPNQASNSNEGLHQLRLNITYNKSTRAQTCSIEGIFSIGRAAEGVVLDQSDAGASRQHCDLYYQGNTLMLRDHSQSGTYINGKRLYQSEAPVQKGDTIQISQHTIEIA